MQGFQLGPTVLRQAESLSSEGNAFSVARAATYLRNRATHARWEQFGVEDAVPAMDFTAELIGLLDNCGREAILNLRRITRPRA